MVNDVAAVPVPMYGEKSIDPLNKTPTEPAVEVKEEAALKLAVVGCWVALEYPESPDSFGVDGTVMVVDVATG